MAPPEYLNNPSMQSHISATLIPQLYVTLQQNNAQTSRTLCEKAFVTFIHIFLSTCCPNSVAACIKNAATNIPEKVTACFNVILALAEQLAPTGTESVVCSLHVATVLLIRGMCFVGRVCGSAYKLDTPQQN